MVVVARVVCIVCVGYVACGVWRAAFVGAAATECLGRIVSRWAWRVIHVASAERLRVSALASVCRRPQISLIVENRVEGTSASTITRRFNYSVSNIPFQLSGGNTGGAILTEDTGLHH